MRTHYFEPGLNYCGVGKTKASRNFAVTRGTEPRTNVTGVGVASIVVIYAQSAGAYSGRKGNSVYVVLQRVNAAPRYLLQFFESDGTQIGGNILVNGADLVTLASTLAADNLGRHFRIVVNDNSNQATQYTGDGFANATKMYGGA